MKVIDQHLSALPRRAEYDDVEAVRELAGRQDVRFEQLGRGRMRSSYALLTTRNVHVAASFHSVGAIAQGAAGKGLCIIGVPGEDGPERSTGGWCADGDCVLIRSGQDYLASSRRPYRTVTVVLSQTRLEQDVETTWGLPLRALAPGRRLGMATPPAQRWLHHRLRAWVSPGRDGARTGLLRPGTDAETEDAIVDAVLRAVGPRPARRSDPGRFALARRAEGMIRESLADDVSITGFAAQLGTSLRTLELGFRDLYGTSLRVYRHALRLNAARRDLLRGDGEESVGTVAVRWGLLHLGRFSADYRRMFGESPRETRQATRRRA